ncbi:FAD-dependent monooxygenase [Micromonospora sp. NPDC049275]|uniref:FAD-dependent monooxygenase n=1 Tax=Micromonospora sp. NPDC049275 TaxID=3364268 RepID=UPI003716DF65
METDVVICGGGPVGLMLAGELRLAGVGVLVVERRTGIDPTIKAGGISTATVEAMYRRGLLPALARQRPAFARTRPPGVPRPAGQFAGIPIDGDLIDTGDPAFRDTGPAGELMVAQQRLEQVLEDHAISLGAVVRRGVELTGFETDDGGVTVRLGRESVRAGWLVGCDGGRSTVRKLAGFAFTGTGPTLTGRQAVVELADAGGLRPGWHAAAGGQIAYWPMPGRIVTVEFDGPPADRDAPVTAAEIEDSVRRVSGTEIRIGEVRTATRYTDNSRLATTYRIGRVLLAGDAAHVHSPFGGQGLNLGLGDAVNLGWKLAATIRGGAPGGLLDTYSSERRPIAGWVLEWTRAQAALMRPDAHSAALREVVTGLLATRDGATYVATRLSGLRHRYPGLGSHPLAGTSAPDLEFADGTRLGEHLTAGGGLLLDLAGSAAVRDLAMGRVRTQTTKCPGRPGLTGVLVRPDGIVAWAGEDGATEGLETALTTWFGTAL